MSESEFQPYLTIVVVFLPEHRTNHGFWQMSMMLRNTANLSATFSIPIEVCLVECKPPFGELRLREILQECENNPFCKIRHIEISSNTFTKAFTDCGELQLKMCARNVGIQRAKAPYILCVNHNVIFSHKIFAFFAQRQLCKKTLYRVIRKDLSAQNIADENEIITGASGLAAYAHRVYYRDFILDLESGDKTSYYYPDGIELHNRPFENAMGKVFAHDCGSFQLLDSGSWQLLQGYPELNINSPEVESVLEFQAIFGGCGEHELPHEFEIYSLGFCGAAVAATAGSSYSSSARSLEFEDMRQIVWQMKFKRRQLEINRRNWGLSDKFLPEYSPSDKLKVTFFCTPKPFTGEFRQIQRNAISNLLRLKPTPEVILIGEEEGYREIAEEFSIKWIKDVERSAQGTPLISSVMLIGQHEASGDVVVYLNSDIMLYPCFMEALRTVQSYRLDSFLMIGQRTDLQVDVDCLSLDDSEVALLRDKAIAEGKSKGNRWIDYFAFPKGFVKQMPPFSVGRPCWDQWFVWNALMSKSAIVDATKMVLALHQIHGYGHVPGGYLEVWRGAEAVESHRLTDNRLWRRHIGNCNTYLHKGRLYLKITSEEIEANTVWPDLPKSCTDCLNCPSDVFEFHIENILGLADLAWANDELHDAYKIYHRLALETLNGDAMINLAELELLRKKSDPRMTAYWLRKCAKLPSINGNNHYGIIFENMAGGINPLNYWEAKYEDGEVGLPSFLLGITHLYGLGVPVNILEALKWFARCEQDRLKFIPEILRYEIEMRGDSEQAWQVCQWLNEHIQETPKHMESYFAMMLKHFPDKLELRSRNELAKKIYHEGGELLLAEIGVDIALGKYTLTDNSIGMELLECGILCGGTVCNKYHDILSGNRF